MARTCWCGVVLMGILAGCSAAPQAKSSPTVSHTRPAAVGNGVPGLPMVYFLVESSTPSHKSVLVRTDAQGKGRTAVTGAEAMDVRSFRVTADGAEVVVLRRGVEGAKDWLREDVAVLDHDGKVVRAIEIGASKNAMCFGPPTLLSGGERVGFVAAVPDPMDGANGWSAPAATVTSVMTVGMDGKALRRVATVSVDRPEQMGAAYGVNVNAKGGQEMGCEQADWSPDGKTILCTLTRIVTDGKGEHARLVRRLWAMDADGGHLRAIGPDGSASGSYSPKGKRIVYLQVGERGSEVMVANADGTNPRQVTHVGGILSSPRWSSDGVTIAFLKGVEKGGLYGSVWAVQSDGTKLRQISRDGEAAWIDHSSDELLIQMLRGLQAK